MGGDGRADGLIDRAGALVEVVDGLHDRFCTDLLSTAGSGVRHWGR